MNMAAKNKKRYLEYQEFKKWKVEKKQLRRMYGTLEKFNRGIFETFVEQIRSGQINTFRDMSNFDINLRVSTLRMILDEIDGTLQQMNKIPSLNFKEEWSVQVLPGFFGAFTRFRVNEYISVYLDIYDRLGIRNKPYWELYDGTDTMRFDMENQEELIACINRLVELRKIPEDIQRLIQSSESSE
jgi:hypothetical protein